MATPAVKPLTMHFSPILMEQLEMYCRATDRRKVSVVREALARYLHEQTGTSIDFSSPPTGRPPFIRDETPWLTRTLLSDEERAQLTDEASAPEPSEPELSILDLLASAGKREL